MTEAQRLAAMLEAEWSRCTGPDEMLTAAAHLRRLEAECEALLTEARYITRQNGEWQEKAAQAMAECEQLRKYKAAAMLMVEDASRYIWLRDSQEGKTVRIMDRRQWNEAIDAAMKETK